MSSLVKTSRQLTLPHFHSLVFLATSGPLLGSMILLPWSSLEKGITGITSLFLLVLRVITLLSPDTALRTNQVWWSVSRKAGRPCRWTRHHVNNVKLCVEPLVNAHLLFLNQELEDLGKQEQTRAPTTGETVTMEGVIWGALEWRDQVQGHRSTGGHGSQRAREYSAQGLPEDWEVKYEILFFCCLPKYEYFPSDW